ncbi:hypothetical protein AOC05_00325 [Arthrobacter alpinus]|uniref:Uncharacterized protein n=1 Tax=Arthrobacter alpinus TaxID=656366 RepID=A0A0M3UFK6_9MICC|nr:hypothetical protein [Arthrobacter alpinus]ALE91169.1 hypothetical protein AOC05_00325 [Arthrobacter alpinus]
MPEYSGPSLTEAISSLQFPVDRASETAVVAAVEQHLTACSISPGDGALLILESLDQWNQTGVPSSLLKKIVPIALTAGLEGDLGSLLPANYFVIFGKLLAGTADWNGLPHTTARRLISRLPLLNHLLVEENMSCSQVSKLLKALETSLDVPYQAVGVIARSLGHFPSLSSNLAGDELWNADASFALSLFPDSDTLGACDIAGKEAEKYLPETDVAHLLRQLSQVLIPTGPINWPYLQILHFCCVPLEFFDHPASYLYEFAPRGQIAMQLFARYPASTGNPVLNNAKAVQTLDRAWARTRGGDDAHALVAILESLESLPHVTRRSLAKVLRSWLYRVIELETSTPIPLPTDLTAEEIERVIFYVADYETNTQGVLEQRIVDGLSFLAFAGEGWRPRGIGDSVNASNLSRHKLGDVEFANVDNRTAIALEAHGGHLSITYVKDHQRSLARIVDQRLEESWSALDDPSAWTIRVIFVAHSRAPSGLPKSEEISKVRIEYEYWDYKQLIGHASASTDRLGNDKAFHSFAIQPLDLKTIRQSVRDRFLAIARPLPS